MKSYRAGKVIRALRAQLGLSAREVARRAGITPAYLSMLESGRNTKTGRPSRPGYEIVRSLSHTLSIDVHTLLELFGYEWDLVRGRRSSSAESGRSYMKGRDFNPGDHILVLSEGSVRQGVRVSIDFALSGIRKEGGAVVRLPPRYSSEEVRRLIKRSGIKYPIERVALVPWDQAVVSSYETRRFTRGETIRAHAKDFSRIQGNVRSEIRFATPDASAYFSWVTNPKAVLEYEYRWPRDLTRIADGLAITSLCLYRLSDLRGRERRDFTLNSMVLRLLDSHSQVWFIDSRDRVSTAGTATQTILSNLNFKSSKEWELAGRVGYKFGLLS